MQQVQPTTKQTWMGKKIEGAQRFLDRLMTVNGGTAAGVWLFGAWLSSRAIAQMGGYDLSGWQSPPVGAVFIAVVLQLILTRGQSPFWRWKNILASKPGVKVPPHVMAIGVFTLLIDTIINGGGVFLIVRGLGNTDMWAMASAVRAEGGALGKIVSAISTTQGQPTIAFIIGVAFMFGLVVAGLTEYFWHLED